VLTWLAEDPSPSTNEPAIGYFASPCLSPRYVRSEEAKAYSDLHHLLVFIFVFIFVFLFVPILLYIEALLMALPPSIYAHTWLHPRLRTSNIGDHNNDNDTYIHSAACRAGPGKHRNPIPKDNTIYVHTIPPHILASLPQKPGLRGCHCPDRRRQCLFWVAGGR